MKTDHDVVLLAGKLNESLDFVVNAGKLCNKLKTVAVTVIKLLEQITECCLFIKEYTGHGFASECITLIQS